MLRHPFVCALSLTLAACSPTVDDDPVAETGSEEESSGEETFDPGESGGSGASETTAAAPISPSDGRFRLNQGAADVDPNGCAIYNEGAPPDWFIAFEFSSNGEPFALTEEFSTFVNEYECRFDGEAMDCQTSVVVDYGNQAVDANVELGLAYRAQWVGENSLEGEFTSNFACQGSGCDAIASEWRVERFPCAVEVQFTGELESED